MNSDGIIRLVFEEEYAIAYKKLYNTEPDDISAVHGGYFAQDRKGGYTDNEKSMAGNKDIYDRILRQKSRLISLDDKLEFIFSHSALGVGWDNPNVFTICTLNESHSQIKKRQEIGRTMCAKTDKYITCTFVTAYQYRNTRRFGYREISAMQLQARLKFLICNRITSKTVIYYSKLCNAQ